MFAQAISGLASRPRTAAVTAALAAYLGLAFYAHPPDGAIETLFVVMPPLEVGFLAGLLALAFDPEPLPPPLAAARFIVWLGVVLGLIWVTTVLSRAAVDAYVRLGAPPIYEAPL